MHHLAIDTYLFHRKVVVREFHEEHPRTYACFCGYSRVYVGLRKSSGLDSGERGMIWFSELSALLDDGYNMLMTCGNRLALISC